MLVFLFIISLSASLVDVDIIAVYYTLEFLNLILLLCFTLILGWFIVVQLLHDECLY